MTANINSSSDLVNSGGVIYNVTIKVSGNIADEWLQWLLNEHIPDVMNTGCFISHQVVRLLEVDDSEGPTYAVQYLSISKADYNRYISMHANEMRERSYKKWGDQFIAFRSVMQLVQ
jgi:hypothetical protein